MMIDHWLYQGLKQKTGAKLFNEDYINKELWVLEGRKFKILETLERADMLVPLATDIPLCFVSPMA